MKPRELLVGEIVQIAPAHTRDGEQWFGGCMMVVTEPEPKPWGC